MKQTAKNGDKVAVHYRGTLENGSEFDSSAGQDPIEFTIGAHEVIEGFENAIIGMAAGDTKRESIPASNAYGEREETLVFEIPRSSLQPGFDVNAGDVVRVTLPDGQTAPMQVLEMNDEAVTLDANHPLAGQTLIFDLELVAIR